MLIDSNVIKELVQTQLDKFREASRLSTNQRTVKDKLNGVIQALELINAGIIYSEKKGDTTMEDVKLMTDKVFNINELTRSKEGSIDKILIEEATKIKPGKAKLVNTERIKWNTFQNRVYNLRKENKIPKSIKPLKRKESFYLANFEE